MATILEPSSVSAHDNPFFALARPVWMKGEERALHARLVFSVALPKKAHAFLFLAGCNFYRVSLNGSFLSFGPARSSHGFARVDEIPLCLEQESNLLQIEVVAYHSKTFYGLDEPGFLQAEVRAGNEVLAYTGKDFLVRKWNEKCRKVIRYSYQRGFSEAYDFSRPPASWETPVLVEGRILQPRNVHLPRYEIFETTFRESGKAFEEKKEIPDDPWLCSKDFATFPSSDYEMDSFRYGLSLSFHKEGIGETMREGDYAIYSLADSKTGFACLSLTALEETEAYLFFDEIDLLMEQGDHLEINFRRIGCNNAIAFRIKKGRFSFQGFEPCSAKYFRLVVRKGAVKDVKVSMRAYQNPDASRLRVSCGDQEIVKIVEAARNNLAANAVDVLTDCPSRERAGWLCDSFFTGRAELLFTGENLVEGNFLENYLHFPANVPAGMLPMCYPADSYDGKYIPNWCLFYILEIADRAARDPMDPLIPESKQNVLGVLSYLSRYENELGLLENLESWVFVEWSKANDPAFLEGVNFPSNMLYAAALREAGKLYARPRLTKKAERLFEAIRALSFNGEFFADNAIRKEGKLQRTENVSEACQYYAFFTKTASCLRYPKLYETLKNDFGAKRNASLVYPHVHKSNAFIGNFLRLMTLVENGDKKMLKDECIAYFSKMADLTGSLWEMDDPCYCSLNHGFASYVANLLVDYLIGYGGRQGNVLRFSSPAVDIDCRVEIPLQRGTLVYERKDGKKRMTFPEGYCVMEVPDDSD